MMANLRITVRETERRLANGLIHKETHLGDYSVISTRGYYLPSHTPGNESRSGSPVCG